jgi:hypothetical protein
MVPPRRLPARALTFLVPSFAVIVLAIAVIGCGSSSDDAGATGAGASDSAESTPTASSYGGKQKKAEHDGEPDAGGQPRSKDSDEGSKGSAGAKQGRSPRSEEGRQAKQAGGHLTDGESVCPDGMTKADCRKRIEATDEGAPGAPVTDPSECTEAMSEEQCKEIVQAQKAAETGTGKSVSPQTCLQEYSREFCELRFGEQAEQQAGQ